MRSSELDPSKFIEKEHEQRKLVIGIGKHYGKGIHIQVSKPVSSIRRQASLFCIVFLTSFPQISVKEPWLV